MMATKVITWPRKRKRGRRVGPTEPFFLCWAAAAAARQSRHCLGQGEKNDRTRQQAGMEAFKEEGQKGRGGKKERLELVCRT